MSRILIANRGEIAIRVARAAAELGMTSVGVYAEDDARALHSRRVDEAVPLRGTGVRAYLDIGQLVAIARELDCDLVHPGYGFLSENPEFSRRCDEAGLAFVGASAELLELLGDKARARQVAEDAKVPLTRGINRACTLEDVEAFMAELGDGRAVMIKALAGGGGRGMRRVTEAAALEEAYRQCREEATIAFGSPDVYVEELVQSARHIEVQVLGDGSGNVIHAWERECTLQRRNQKVLEIAPSPTLDEDTRAAIVAAALRVAGAVQYRGIGTFEFLVDAADPSRFFFMEINPRVQVEHTVTEEITGLDLVVLQTRLAQGASLTDLRLTEAPPRNGVAIQARVNTETIEADGSTRPASGVVAAYDPPGGHGVRVDDYLYTGYRVNPNYDSLAAKLIVHADNYEGALRKISRGLREMRLEGVANNRTLLLNLVSRPEVIANQVTTAYLETQMGSLVNGPGADSQLYFDDEQTAHTVAEDTPIPEGHQGVASPTAGTLIALGVEAGDEVQSGQTLARVEAMKMEFSVDAPTSGTVIDVRAPSPGSIVDEGQVLIVVAPSNEAADALGVDAEIDLDRIRPDLAEVIERHRSIEDVARPAAVARRRDAGKRTARENVADLLDAGSFNEYGAMAVAAQRAKYTLDELIERSPADGLILGTGTVNEEVFGAAAQCAVMAYDYTVMGGSQGFANHKKTDRMLELVKRLRVPLVCFTEGGGGRSSDTDYPAVAALDLHTFNAFAELSGLVPTVGIAAGNCFAGNAAIFGLCDVTIATKAASIGMAGPVMVEGGGLGSFRPEEIGPVPDLSRNGVVDIVVEDEADAVSVTKRYLSYFQGPLAHWEADDQRKLRHLVPDNRKQVYDVRKLIETLADGDSVLELRREFARSAITAFVRIEGRPLGLMANDPAFLGGAIDADAGDKFARFSQLCDAHELPVVVLCDTPGFMVGPASERNATVRHVSRMFVAAANATTPVVTIVVRKAYGLGAMAMSAGGFSSPVLAASWPTGEFGSMGIEGAVRIAARQPARRHRRPPGPSGRIGTPGRRRVRTRQGPQRCQPPRDRRSDRPCTNASIGSVAP